MEQNVNGMKDDMDRFSAINERDVDLMLLEELICNADFAGLVYTRVKEHSVRVSLPQLDGISCRAHHSVSYVGAGSGESDIEVNFYDSNSGEQPKVVLLLEDKIGALFTPQQPERYLERAKDIQNKTGRPTVTLLVAPSAYINSNTTTCFDATLTYEEVISWLSNARTAPPEEITKRLHHRACLLQHALEKYRRGGNRTHDEERTIFFSEYERYMGANFPVLTAKPARSRTAGSSGFFFDIQPKLTCNFDQLHMMHGMTKGFVELEIRGLHDRRTYLVPRIGEILPEKMYIDAPSEKSFIKIGIKGLPHLDLKKSFEEQGSDVHLALAAAETILKWYIKNYETLDQWGRESESA